MKDTTSKQETAEVTESDISDSKPTSAEESSKSKKRTSVPPGYYDKTPLLEDYPAPPLQTRFLLGKAEELSDILSSANPVHPITAWRSFSDEEDLSLHDAWYELNEEVRSKALEKSAARLEDPKPKPVKDQDESAHLDSTFDPDNASPPGHVQVGLDSLFTVDLLELSCYPVFWVGGRVPVQLASWFYSSATPNKYIPVESALAEKLEAAYHRIKPWIPSYADELKAAVGLGAESEQKLRAELDDSAIDAIFQGPESARIYSRGVASRLSKSILTTFLSGSGQHAGGSLVLRGYDAMLRNQASKLPKTADRTPSRTSRSSSPAPSERRRSDASPPTSRPSSPAPTQPRSGAAEKLASILRTKSSTASLRAKASTVTLRGRESKASLRETAAKEAAHISIEEADKNDQAHPKSAQGSAQILEQPNVFVEGDEEEKPVELKNLVLVIHGIGQKLADIYESFSFNHAVNQLRANANKHCTDPAYAALIAGQRAQFLPIRWRANLKLEGGSVDTSGDTDSEKLDNRFTIEDIEPEGIPFIRSLVSNVLIDLPFYLSHHRSKMTKALVLEANRVYRLFCHRNPNFEKNGGKVSIIAHSLGSLLATDILSEQPCIVPPLADQPLTSLQSSSTFCFNTSSAFFVGSPVAFFFYLNGAQLIARSGRERTKDVPPDIALDRTRWGCLAVDDLYNVYYSTDPVAYALNAVVDVKHSKRLKPIAIPSQTSSLLEGIGSSFARVSSLWSGMSVPYFGTSTTAAAPEEAQKTKITTEEHKSDGTPAAAARPFPLRTTTYDEMGAFQYAEMKRAEQRFTALNPQGNLDYYLPDESYSTMVPYYGALMAHGNYWSDIRFSAFIVTQILASPKALEANKRKLEGQEDLTVD